MKLHYCPVCAAPLVEQVLDAKPRLACAKSCGFVHWNNPTPVVAALVLHHGKVLLVRQPNWPEGWLGLVTGFLEAGEEPGAAAAREVAEELGLRAVSIERIGEYAFIEQNQIILAYAITAEGEVALSSELSEVKPVEVGKLRPWPFGTGRAVADWLEGREVKSLRT